MKKEKNNKIDKNQNKELKKLTLNKKTLKNSAIAIAILVVICAIFWGEEGKHIIEAKSTIKRISTIENLNTVKYTYNAIATKTTKEKEEKYHVAYEGTVRVGINFKEIEISEKDKKITISVPSPKITETTIDESKLDFMFTKEKYDKENVIEEAIELCKKDIETNAKKEELLFDTAKENTLASVKALMKPWEESLDKKYTVEYIIKEDK